MENTFASQFALAYVSTHILEFLKNSEKFPIMQKNTVVANKIVAAIFAFMVSVGIHMAHTFVVNPDGTHLLTLTIAIPAWSDLIEHVWDWVLQFVFQEANFKMFIKNGNGNGSTNQAA